MAVDAAERAATASRNVRWMRRKELPVDILRKIAAVVRLNCTAARRAEAITRAMAIVMFPAVRTRAEAARSACS